MCGIAGMMMTNGEAPEPALLRAMGAALAHRGPDGKGRYRAGNLGMIQTRLAIIDLVTGDQPLYEPEGAALIANGEIYNYLELRADMSEIAFATSSDCETPLHLYRRYGLDFTKHLRGMYAIALHDPGQDRLVLARDPFGIKPLYYVETPQGFAFASEPEALIAAGVIGAKLLPEGRNELLQLQFITGRRTALAGIGRVLPGETLVVAGGRIVERRRDAMLPSGRPIPQTEKEALKAFDRIFADSVTVHQRSDVPYGMFLSGGIDSSAVLAMMARLNARPVIAFTAGFDSPTVADERVQARTLASSLGAEHVEVSFDERDFWELLPQIARIMDDPAADYATLPTFKLAQAARAAGIKVILSGEGGDELFAGYGRYRSLMRSRLLGGRKMRHDGTLDQVGVLRAEISGWRNGMEAAEREAAKPGRTRLQVGQATDCADWLPHDLLLKLDRCLMAHGVEGRTPFLDRRVADFAFLLPDDLKVRGGTGKWLLRQWLADKVPASQPFAKKQGFTVPVGDWIARQGARLGPMVARQAGVHELCNPDAVEFLFRAANNKRDGQAAWNLLFYALWHRQHIERLPAGPDVFSSLS